jgi:hypothetical protein
MGDYDYVIVSAGSAGCVRFARLSEDPGLRLAHGAGDVSICDHARRPGSRRRRACPSMTTATTEA